ncbi:MAG: hypothetical protein K6G71_09185 [Clostridiales bacterium]|nr:hypothetical protein [Clostridiales bacterium]
MNKSDLRYQKTEIAIRDAYLKLKKSNSAVSVKDLCEAAMINKTTFYGHYETMESLHKQVCTEFVADMLSHCDKIDGLLNAPRDFIVSVYRLFSGNRAAIDQLYGTDFNMLLKDIENILMDQFIPNNMDDDARLTVQFCIGGSFRILLYESAPNCIQKTVELVEKVLA